MAQPVSRMRRAQRLAFSAVSATVALIPAVAWAQCAPLNPGNGGTVTCSGASSTYTDTADTGVKVVVSSGATVTAPLQIGTGGFLTNGGTISGSTAIGTVQYGDNASITNNGTIVSSGATSGSAAIIVGDHSTVINNGTLTAYTGTPAVQFGDAGSTATNGTFTNSTLATAAVTGNIVFGTNIGVGNVATLNNNNIAYGLTGNVTSSGNTAINNNGLWTGNFTETATSGTFVKFTNGTGAAGASYTGVISTGDTTNLTNSTNGSMLLYTGSGLGTSLVGLTNLTSPQVSTLTNNGILSIGTSAAPALVNVTGNFTQNSSAQTSGSYVNTNTNFYILAPVGGASTAGTTFSQIHAVSATAGVGGKAALNGTITVNVGPGFYATNSKYNVIVADNGISGNFGTAVVQSTSGTPLVFIGFTPTGCTSGTCPAGTETITTTTVSNGTSSTVTTAVTPGATVGTTTTTSGSTTTTTTTSVVNYVSPSGSAGIVTIAGTQQAYQFSVTRPGTYYQVLAGLTSVPVTPNPNSFENTNELNIAGGPAPHTGGLGQLVNTATTDLNTPGQTTDDVITLVGQIDVLSIAQMRTFLDSVSPEGYLAYRTALHDQANAFERTIALRMTDQNSNHDEDGWWFNTQGEYEFASSAPSANGYRTHDNLFGLAGGYDFSGPHHVYGLAMNMSWDSLHYAPGYMNGTNHDFALAAYGAYNLGPVRFSGQAAYNMGGLKATKDITLGSVSRVASAHAGEHLLKLNGTISIDMKAAGILFTPFGGIDYAYGAVKAFTETGANAADLSVLPINANRTDLLAGISVTRASGALRPYLRAAYRNQIGGNGPATVSAYFNAESDTTFSVDGVGEARHELDANAGVNWVFDDAGTLFAGYQGTMRTGHSSHGLNVGVRLEF